VRFDDTINTESTIALFEQLEQLNVLAVCIYVICDNARYYRSKAVREYLKTSRIELVFLPPYSPNLNHIEQLWKFFKMALAQYKAFKRVRMSAPQSNAWRRKRRFSSAALKNPRDGIIEVP